MENSINRWFSRHPYAVVGLVFLVMAVLGWKLFDWDERHFGFMLLLYFIAALGVRLDEISRSIGGPAGHSHGRAGDADSLIARLKEIEDLLRRIDAKLPGPDRREG